MHWDPTYATEVRGWSCNKGAPSSGYGKFGNHMCDPPMSLITSAVKAMKNIYPEPDFLVWTG